MEDQQVMEMSLEKEETRDCAFQYAYTIGHFFRQTKIVRDETGLTLTEAKALLAEYKKDIMRMLQNEDLDSLEAVVWVDMKDEHSYGDSLIYITHEYKTDGKDIWKEVKEYVTI